MKELYFGSLQRSRYSEAVALNEQLDSRQAGRSNSNASTRKAIMERFSRSNLFQVGREMKTDRQDM